jgi:hypothetical protein
MARVTRSKKVEIAEDNAAQTVELETLPLAHSVSQIQPFSDVTGNTMTTEELTVEAEMKGLKAAYRITIGDTKKNKKGKNKKKANAQQESEDAHIVENNGFLVRADRQETSQGSLVSRMDRLSLRDDLTRTSEDNLQLDVEKTREQHLATQPATKANVPEVVERPVEPAVRTTRRQAKAKEGPYEDLPVDVLSGQNEAPEIGRPKEIDFLMSLIVGRTAGPSRSLNSSVSGMSAKSGRMANDYLFIAEEALRKSSREVPKETADVQAPGKAVLSQAEFKQLGENVKDHQVTLGQAKSAFEPAKIQAEGGDEDSFVEKITCRSPAKTVSRTRDSLELIATTTPSTAKSAANPINRKAVAQVDDADEDSFVEQISSRSPAKPISRIEDSVEALDQMEEVEEALHEAAMAERMVSPEKMRQKPKEQPSKASAPVSTKATRGPAATKQQVGSRPGYASVRVKPTAAKHTSTIKKAASMTFKPIDSSETSSIREEMNKSVPITKKASVKRPTSLLPPKEPVKSAKPVTRPTNFELPGQAIARKLKEQKEARLAQRTESSEDSFHTAHQCSGPSVKSTKPLTKPAFELPGEALSRKKREAHEAKLKAQEEEERKRREFKAKPVRKSMISTIRDTVASRARQSKIGIENIADGNLIVSKRGSNVGAHRPSIQELHAMANTSATRAPAPAAPLERKPSTKFHGPSMSGLAMQRTVSASDVQVQRQRAKEIYNRDNKLAEDIERERREREAAAKRSREEAAERGRQASREWAAKQMAKKLAEGDKGMSAGYGPGGQMGLKA